MIPQAWVWAHGYLYSRIYADMYWVRQIVSWALIFLVILELYDQSLEDYEGLRRISRLFITRIGVLLMLAVCGSILFGSVVEADPRQWINAWMLLMQRSIRLVYAGLLLGLALFLGWFQVRVSPMVRYLVVIWLADTLMEAVAAALRYRFGSQVYLMVAIAASAGSIAVEAGWYWAINQLHVAERTPWPARQLSPDQAGVLLRRLQTIEGTLARAYR